MPAYSQVAAAIPTGSAHRNSLAPSRKDKYLETDTFRSGVQIYCNPLKPHKTAKNIPWKSLALEPHFFGKDCKKLGGRQAGSGWPVGMAEASARCIPRPLRPAVIERLVAERSPAETTRSATASTERAQALSTNAREAVTLPRKRRRPITPGSRRRLHGDRPGGNRLVAGGQLPAGAAAARAQ